MNPNVLPDRSKLYSVQILRGLAAGAVVVAHIIEHPGGKLPDQIFTIGKFGVEIFFVLSGFIIAHITASGVFDARDFLTRRLFRVAPLYWICTTLVFVIAVVAPSLFKTTEADFWYFVESMLFIPAHSPSMPDDWRPIMKLGFTLNYEMFFYAAFACFWWCSSAVKRVSLLSLVMGALVLLSLFLEPRSSVLTFYSHLNLMPFIMGMWLGIAEGRDVWERLRPIHAGIILAGAVVATLATFSLPFTEFALPFGHGILTLAATLVVCIGLYAERWNRYFARNPLTKLGDISYSLYLTHMFVVGFGWFVVKRLGISGVSLAFAGLLMVLACLVAASISYRLLEKPSTTLGRNVSRKFFGAKSR